MAKLIITSCLPNGMKNIYILTRTICARVVSTRCINNLTGEPDIYFLLYFRLRRNTRSRKVQLVVQYIRCVERFCRYVLHLTTSGSMTSLRGATKCSIGGRGKFSRRNVAPAIISVRFLATVFTAAENPLKNAANPYK